mgnify:CR=1 FL=1
MAQVSKYPISKAVYERILDVFFKTLIEIRTKSEANQFINDFLTPTEQIMLSKRLAIAFLLEKEYDFRSISKILRVSLTTIASVNLIRKYGGRGYQKMIGKLLREEKVKDFLSQVAETINGKMGKSRKGGEAWRYLHKELEKKGKKKPF